jgi:hypothetical protein
MSLLRTFSPVTDESGLGYYRRLSAVNGLAGWKELASLCELPLAQGSLPMRPQLVAEVLGLQPAWTQQAWAADDLARSWRALRRKGDAVCSQCLRSHLYVRSHWEHSYVVACREHRVMLIDHCDACGERLTVNRERIEQCPCGRDLRRVPAEPALPAFIWLAALLAQGTSDGEWGPPVKDVQVDVLSLLIRTLCVFANPEAANARQNSPVPRTIREASSFLEPLQQMLADWPRGFEVHVGKRLACASPDARTLSSALGKWYMVLKSCCTDDHLTCFLQAVVRVAEEQFGGLIGSGGVSAPASATHMFASHAAKRIGVHRETLVSHAKKGNVVHRTKKFGSRGLAYEIPIEEVEAIKAARKQWVSFQSAGELLGVPDTLVTRLVDSGAVVSDPHWRRDVRKAGPVSRLSVTTLISRIKSHRSRSADQENGEGRIALRQLSGRRVGDQQALGRAIGAIVAGDIRPLVRAEKVGDFVYSMLDVGRHFSTPLLEAGLSIQALSKLTGWKWETISHWIECGLLKSTAVTLRGQPSRVVMPSHLLEFSTRYAPLADVASQLGSKSSALAEKLRGIEIVGAMPLPNGQRRGGLLRIADLAEMAVAYKKLVNTQDTR